MLRTLHVRTANLYVIRCWTGNQCSWCSNGLAWISPRRLDHSPSCIVLYSLQFLNNAGRCAVKHSVAINCLRDNVLYASMRTLSTPSQHQSITTHVGSAAAGAADDEVTVAWPLLDGEDVTGRRRPILLDCFC